MGWKPRRRMALVAAASTIIDAHCRRTTLAVAQYEERLRIAPDRNTVRRDLFAAGDGGACDHADCFGQRTLLHSAERRVADRRSATGCRADVRPAGSLDGA